ncbi:MAG: methyl-accepting chemotaxis protein [Deltaproteobacteria bacterium]|nr:methyl-accepting chemotaxis protein [Deltaproteobacteria bacterium]
MKRLSQMSMRWKLTLGATTVLLLVGIILSVVIRVYNEKSDAMLFDALKGRALANVSTASGFISFEIVANLGDDAKKKLSRFISSSDETRSILVFRADRKPFIAVGKEIEYESLISQLKSLDRKRAVIVDEFVVAVSPVLSEDDKETLGYIIYIESMADYHALRAEMSLSTSGAFLLGLIIIMGGVYIIGYRSTDPILKLISAAEAISAGDLEKINIASDASTSNETNRLATSVKAMAEALQRQVMAIKSLIDDMFGISKEVSASIAQLASSASEQASAVTETAATVEEMEKTGRNAAGNANSIVDAAEKTTEASIRGREAVKTTNDIIIKIRADSEEISGKSAKMLSAVEEIEVVINTVKGIADQSKILAVNASIEAAKAGEYGTGFAVVAQEVKDLAEQSKEAALQITGALPSIRKAIENMVETAKAGKQRTEAGVSMIANAGAIMNDLSEAIKENSAFANVIATNIKQHTVGLSQIATAMEQINSTAIENRNVSQRIEQSMQQVTAGIDELQALVSHWRTPSRSL